jgi:hypothetical protein
MNLTELKAKCYDILAQIEYLQGELQKTNAEISKLIKENEGKGQSVTD